MNDSSQLAIKKATINDIPLIRSLAQQIWPQTYSNIISPEQIDYMMELMYSENALKKQMEKNNQFIVVCNNDAPVGFASYNKVESLVYKLQKIYVLPSQQGKGTGKFLITQIINDIKTKGATALRLNVNRYNPAKSFYEKLGFAVIRTEDIDIGNGFFMNDYIMEKQLKE